jgi:5-methylcytosine-specific restriction endonuclease McrA
MSKSTFTVKDVIEKFGENPICYLTGEQIDINKPRTYHFDHIIPRSRGGDSSIDNLGICTKRANLAKHDMTPDEFEHLCKRVLEHNGYIVTKCEK